MKSFPNGKKSFFSILFIISIIGIIGFSLTAYPTDSAIPDWVKNNAKWWSDGSISEADYVKSLEYLIMHGIINIPIPITEVTAAQTTLTEEERAQSFKVTISNIIAPLSVHFFEKFEMTTSEPGKNGDTLGRMYSFRDINPTFFLESLPSVDKKQFYKFVGSWMSNGETLNKFNVDVDVLDGTGAIVHTWSFTKCDITSYGTYLQDATFVYQYSGIKDSEIRDRTNFSCVGVSLKAP